MKAWIMHVWIAGFALALMACGGEEDPENLCVPGVAQPCPCEGVIQECKPDGSGFTSCDCSASEGGENASEEEAGEEENEVGRPLFPERRGSEEELDASTAPEEDSTETDGVEAPPEDAVEEESDGEEVEEPAPTGSAGCGLPQGLPPGEFN